MRAVLATQSSATVMPFVSRSRPVGALTPMFPHGTSTALSFSRSSANRT
jgi:hypothetical protein